MSNPFLFIAAIQLIFFIPPVLAQTAFTPPSTELSRAQVSASKTSSSSELQAELAAYQRGDFGLTLIKLIPLANQGDAEAQLQLGVMNEQGQGVPKNFSRAMARYRQAADQGNAEAQYRLGEKYDLGLGIAQDKKAAEAWYRKAAAQGNAQASAKLTGLTATTQQAVAAELAYWENVKAKQTAEAEAKADAEAQAAKRAIAAELAYWKKVNDAKQKADSGVSNVKTKQAKSGLQAGLEAYQNGDYPTVLKQLIPLANSGDAAAQLQLGTMNEQGLGVSKNPQRAALRYRQAAVQGNAEAQYRLGKSYLTGLGIAQDKIVAMEWLKKSAAQGYEAARDLIDEETNKVEHIRLAAEAKAIAKVQAEAQAKLAAEAKAKADAEEKKIEQAKVVAQAPMAKPIQHAPASPSSTSLPSRIIERSLMDWATAWSNKNARDYLAAYAPSYHPSDKSREAWKQQRTERINKPKIIEVGLSNIKVSTQDDEHASVTFTQAYRSDNYHDQVEKMLKLEKQHGRWFIVEEKSVE